MALPPYKDDSEIEGVLESERQCEVVCNDDAADAKGAVGPRAGSGRLAKVRPDDASGAGDVTREDGESDSSKYVVRAETDAADV